MSDDNKRIACISCASIAFILALVILLPISFSYLEYYEYGLAQRKTSGRVSTSKVYSQGRHLLGPDRRFFKYQADAHYEFFDQLSVFSAGGSNDSIGLNFLVDVDFTYFLIKEEVGVLHKELANSYRSVVVSRAKDAIKNEAADSVSFTEYFQARQLVEERFRSAVQRRWEAAPSVHCVLDQFHIGRIRIPESVANKQLDIQLQNERNDREEFLQQAQIEREITSVEVNTIRLETTKALRTARAQASLIRANAIAEAERIKAEASSNGTRILVESVGITTQEHLTSFRYIRTLKNRKEIELDIIYNPENILQTRSVGAVAQD